MSHMTLFTKKIKKYIDIVQFFIFHAFLNLMILIYYFSFSKSFEIPKKKSLWISIYLTKNVRANTRGFFRSAMQNWPEPKACADGTRALSYLDFIWCFAPGISWVFTALLVTTKSHFWNASAIRERIMSADCSSVEIGAERIERTGVFATNISICSGWVSCTRTFTYRVIGQKLHHRF